MHTLLQILCLSIVVSATIDLNVHQLQFIADHLDAEECRKLAEMLHHTELQINSSIPITGENEPKKPCIFLLLRWDRTEGYEKTFDRLALRLRQLGRPDLSEFLAKAVIGEDDMKIKENFLRNPFRKQIPAESALLSTDSKKRPKGKPSAEETTEDAEGLETWEIASIVCGSLMLFICLVFIVYKLFGTVISRLFRNLAPDIFVDWCSLTHEQCKWCCKRAKRKYDRHVIGKKPPRCMTVEDRKSVIDLNRNLNNYMNGELESASTMFP